MAAAAAPDISVAITIAGTRRPAKSDRFERRTRVEPVACALRRGAWLRTRLRMLAATTLSGHGISERNSFRRRRLSFIPQSFPMEGFRSVLACSLGESSEYSLALVKGAIELSRSGRREHLKYLRRLGRPMRTREGRLVPPREGRPTLERASCSPSSRRGAALDPTRHLRARDRCLFGSRLEASASRRGNGGGGCSLLPRRAKEVVHE
jgi:hypothetical protein